MKEYGVQESWIKHFSFDFHDFGGRFLRPLWVRNKGEVITVCQDGRLISYDPDGGEVKDLGVHGSRSDDYRRSIHVESYVESLILIGRGPYASDSATCKKLPTLHTSDCDSVSSCGSDYEHNSERDCKRSHGSYAGRSVNQYPNKTPTQVLIKFRCVSKSWNSLISSPYFISLHAQQSTCATNHFIIRSYSKNQNAEIYSVHSDTDGFHELNDIRIENPFRDLTRFYYRIVGSSNGVLCLSDNLFGHTHSIFLWNPVIRRKITLPPPKSTFESTWPCMCVLGFGFDAKNDDYKVVRVAYCPVEYGYSVPPKVEVYALSERKWRGISGKIPRSWMVDYFWSQAFVNGNVHWIAYRSNAMRAEVENVIIVFDMSNELFDEMPLPDTLTSELPYNLNTAVFGQSLGIYQYDVRVCSESCSVWVMNKYGDAKSWVKKFNIDLEGGVGMVLGVRRNGDVLLSARNGELIAYNPDTEETMKLGILGTKDSFYVCSHVESLALLIEGEEARERPPCNHNGEDAYGRVANGELRRQSRQVTARARTLEISGNSVLEVTRLLLCLWPILGSRSETVWPSTRCMILVDFSPDVSVKTSRGQMGALEKWVFEKVGSSIMESHVYTQSSSKEPFWLGPDTEFLR
ncbi:hypothetical protein DH2020_011784 [Rehmannia glutinosa]|uniref:F-box associated beta-propeller type 1 domain-containing protein n=1 Tax=Rehmannia glutinosa TaxID=99300 RepID=A0ABR0XEG3_REHGL